MKLYNDDRRCIDFCHVFISVRNTGSPFSLSIMDGGRATASGDGLGSNIIANKLASFFVNTKMVCGDAELVVVITCMGLFLFYLISVSRVVCTGLATRQCL